MPVPRPLLPGDAGVVSAGSAANYRQAVASAGGDSDGIIKFCEPGRYCRLTVSVLAQRADPSASVQGRVLDHEPSCGTGPRLGSTSPIASRPDHSLCRRPRVCEQPRGGRADVRSPETAGADGARPDAPGRSRSVRLLWRRFDSLFEVRDAPQTQKFAKQSRRSRLLWWARSAGPCREQDSNLRWRGGPDECRMHP